MWQICVENMQDQCLASEGKRRHKLPVFQSDMLKAALPLLPMRSVCGRKLLRQPMPNPCTWCQARRPLCSSVILAFSSGTSYPEGRPVSRTHPDGRRPGVIWQAPSSDLQAQVLAAAESSKVRAPWNLCACSVLKLHQFCRIGSPTPTPALVFVSKYPVCCVTGIGMPWYGTLWSSFPCNLVS